MALARVHTAQPGVLRGDIVTVDADLSRGLHSFTIVGLAGKAVEESKERVSAAIKNSGFTSPKQSNKRVTISLAPADLKKEGPLFDLPIALSYLAASDDVRELPDNSLALGELALDGTLRGVRGILPAIRSAVTAGYNEVIVPDTNAREAALVRGITVTPARSLIDVTQHIDASREDHVRIPAQPKTEIRDVPSPNTVTIADVKGQETAKRGLLIAAAGRHNVLMVGPPGTGKTMLARAFADLLPPLSATEAIEMLAIHSLVGLQEDDLTSRPPYRAPHHTASYTALVGGGTDPRPGEVTLAHNGVLFMDEFPEFDRRALDALRQPLEERIVTISRVAGTAAFPADFILLAALNPYRGSEDGTTDYRAAMRATYGEKVSGPILDRIDLWLEVPHVPHDVLAHAPTDAAESVRAKRTVRRARAQQHQRFKNQSISANANLSARDIDTHLHLSDSVTATLTKASAAHNLSPRSYHRVIKVARTIADLDGADEIDVPHVLEALQYRVRTE